MTDEGIKVTLKEIFKSTVPFKDSHEADSLFFNCCDFRFRKQSQEFLGDRLMDPFVFPGGIMLFVGGKHGHADLKDGTLYWTKAMVKLHHVKEIKLVIHKDCGAYKAAPALAGKSPEEMYNIQMRDIKEVKEMLSKEIPEVTVTAYYMDLARETGEVTYNEISFE